MTTERPEASGAEVVEELARRFQSGGDAFAMFHPRGAPRAARVAPARRLARGPRRHQGHGGRVRASTGTARSSASPASPAAATRPSRSRPRPGPRRRPGAPRPSTSSSCSSSPTASSRRSGCSSRTPICCSPRWTPSSSGGTEYRTMTEPVAAAAEAAAAPEPLARARRLPADARRKSILAAARHAFSETGDMNGTTIKAIAERGGISEGVIYRHFESKEQLFYEAVVEPLNEAVDELIAASDIVDRDEPLTPGAPAADDAGPVPPARVDARGGAAAARARALRRPERGRRASTGRTSRWRWTAWPPPGGRSRTATGLELESPDMSARAVMGLALVARAGEPLRRRTSTATGRSRWRARAPSTASSRRSSRAPGVGDRRATRAPSGLTGSRRLAQSGARANL